MFSQVHVLYPMRAGRNGNPILDQPLAVSTSAVAPTGYADASGGNNGVTLVTFDVQSNNLRCRWDGVAPTSTTGHLLYAGTSYTWNVGQYNAAQFIQDTAAAGAGSIWASAMNV